MGMMKKNRTPRKTQAEKPGAKSPQAGKAGRAGSRALQPLAERFLQIAESLEREKVAYAFIGGYAMALHGAPRTTQDLDVFIRPDRENVDRLVAALKRVFRDDALDQITFEELERFPVIRYSSPDGFFIEVLAKVEDLLAFEDMDSQCMTVEGRMVRVATPETLFRLKKDALRPVDREDARFLERLIEKRGQ
jgi:hypothetical protein